MRVLRERALLTETKGCRAVGGVDVKAIGTVLRAREKGGRERRFRRGCGVDRVQCFGVDVAGRYNGRSSL